MTDLKTTEISKEEYVRKPHPKHYRNIAMVAFKPVELEGNTQYNITVDYTPTENHHSVSLTGTITLAMIMDHNDYTFKDGQGGWQRSYEERWLGDYVVSLGSGDDAQKIPFSVMYYTSFHEALNSVMEYTSDSFDNLNQDDLEDISEF